MATYQNTTAFPNQPMDPEDCTLETCPLSESIFGYQPIVSLALIPLVYFGMCAIGHGFIGIWYRTWSFSWPIVFFCIREQSVYGQGCHSSNTIIMTAVEVGGYLARYLAHESPFKDAYYLSQIVLLTLAPIFICASIYICLGRMYVIIKAQLVISNMC